MNHNVFKARLSNFKAEFFRKGFVIGFHKSLETKLMCMQPDDFGFHVRFQLILFSRHADITLVERIPVRARYDFSLLDVSRSLAVGSGSTVGRVGSIVAPLCIYLSSIWIFMPQVFINL